jgi:hypothetical protein
MLPELVKESHGFNRGSMSTDGKTLSVC